MKKYSLDLPIWTCSDRIGDDPIQITGESDNHSREYLQQLSDYFVKEFDYNRPPRYVDPSIGQQEYRGYLFIKREYDGKLIDTYRIYGACCFSKMTILPEPYWKLEWIWLHPFFRHRGNLRKHWEFLEKECGNDFFIKKPISLDMQHFLGKVSGCHRECS